MNDLKAQVEDAVMARGGKKQGAEIRFRCPNENAHRHGDSDPSANYNPSKAVWICRVCGESGNYWNLGILLGVINNGHRSDGYHETRRWDIGGMAVHKRLDRDGDKKVVEWERQGKTGLGGLPTADLPLYTAGLPWDKNADILVNEGEKKTDALLALGFTACGTVTGAAVTPSIESLLPISEHPGRVFLCCDNDQAGRDHMARIAARLLNMGKCAFIIDWPGVPEKGDAYDFIAAGNTADDVRALLAAAAPYDGEAENGQLPGHGKRNYIIVDSRGKESLDLESLVNDLLADFRFATYRDNDEILVYRDGFYQVGGDTFIKSECQARMGVTPLLTEHKVREVIGHIIRSTYVERSAFDSDPYTLNLINGLLDTGSRKLRPHTADYLSVIRIPVTYDETVDCPAIRRFLSEVHHPQDIPVVQELAGYCLVPDNCLQKAFLFVGGGDQGKSTELGIFKAFLGAKNISNVPWHALELNRFALSALHGKLANIFADLPSHSLNLTSSFKMLTGGDDIGTEKKFSDHFSFVNHAKLIFSANKPPRVLDEDSYAFWRRWIILDFPNQISPEKKDIHLLEKLTTPEELSGFLNIALEGLARLRAAGRFSYDKNVEDTTEYYLRAADPVYAFLQDCIEVSPQDWVAKDDLYQAFQSYCIDHCLPVTKPNSFARNLQNQPAYRITSIRPEVSGKRVMAWQGVKLSVRDVRDVNDFSLLIVNSENIQKDNKGKENVDNPDAIATITHDRETLTDTTTEMPDYVAALGMPVKKAPAVSESSGLIVR